jgi:putative effector of murein hydrolase
MPFREGLTPYHASEHCEQIVVGEVLKDVLVSALGAVELLLVLVASWRVHLQGTMQTAFWLEKAAVALAIRTYTFEYIGDGRG